MFLARFGRKLDPEVPSTRYLGFVDDCGGDLALKPDLTTFAALAPNAFVLILIVQVRFIPCTQV